MQKDGWKVYVWTYGPCQVMYSNGRHSSSTWILLALLTRYSTFPYTFIFFIWGGDHHWIEWPHFCLLHCVNACLILLDWNHQLLVEGSKVSWVYFRDPHAFSYDESFASHGVQRQSMTSVQWQDITIVHGVSGTCRKIPVRCVSMWTSAAYARTRLCPMKQLTYLICILPM